MQAMYVEKKFVQAHHQKIPVNSYRWWGANMRPLGLIFPHQYVSMAKTQKQVSALTFWGILGTWPPTGADNLGMLSMPDVAF